MKQVFVTSTGRGSYVTPIPTPGPTEILVAVHASVISTGTETMDLRKEKQTLSEKITEKKVLWEKVQKVVKEKGLNSALNAILRKLSPSEKSALFRPDFSKGRWRPGCMCWFRDCLACRVFSCPGKSCC